MARDPFAGLTDTNHERQQRSARFRRQKWRVFWVSAGATALIAVATGAGGAGVGVVSDRDVGVAVGRFLGGVVYGLAGGVFLLLLALWGLTRQAVTNEIHGEADGADAGAVLFWASAAGAVAFGGWGASSGLSGGAGGRPDVLWGAVAVGLLTLVPALLLRRFVRRRSRTGAGSAKYRESR